MTIGLIDVDGHNFPNIALMRLASWHRQQGDDVEWAMPMFGRYDRIYASKIFTFTPDFNPAEYTAREIVRGGTGYDIKSRLPEEVERHTGLAYDLYPQYPFSVQFYSRGCIRHCPFCLVHDKEGGIHPVEPMQWNPRAQWIEVLDNNFFANPEWRTAVEDLKAQRLPVKFHGVDIRIMDEEQAEALNSLRMKGYIHIAWDLPQIDLTERLEAITRHIRPSKIACYVLVGFNSTKEQDLYRLRTLKRLGILPFVQPYRDYANPAPPVSTKKTWHVGQTERGCSRRWTSPTTSLARASDAGNTLIRESNPSLIPRGGRKTSPRGGREGVTIYKKDKDYGKET